MRSTTPVDSTETIIALGGAIEVQASVTANAAMSISIPQDSTSILAPLTITVAAREASAIVRGIWEGEGRLLVSVNDDVTPLAYRVLAADRVSLDLPDYHNPVGPGRAFLGSVPTVQVAIRGASDDLLVDTSLTMGEGTDPVFEQWAWDQLSIDATPGTYPLVLTSDAIGELREDVIVVGSVENIIAENVDTTSAGHRVCFHGVHDGRHVMGRGWRFSTDRPDFVIASSTLSNCVDYEAAPEGAEIIASFAGVEQRIALPE
ncbi:MAG: hypothetical protein AB7P03_10020 [Kofleriaceae bacterium]